MKTLTKTLGTAFFLGTSVVVGAAYAQEDFYAGKQISLVIPASAGGSYGIYALLLSDHLPRHIPGEPTIVPEYMSGAGGMRASNFAANNIASDGTAMYMMHQNAPTQQLLAPDQAQYDAAAFPPIGVISAMNSVMIASNASGIETVEDATKGRVVIGSTGRGSYQFIVPTLLNEFLDTQFDIVTTYTGTAETMLALERGEIQAFMTSLLSVEESHPDWVTGEGTAQVILQVGATPDPSLPDVPLLSDYAQDDDQRAVLEFLSISNAMARPLVMAPGTPDEHVEIIRSAFEAMMQDPDFLAAAQELGAPVAWADADTLGQIIASTLAAPEEVIALTASMMVEE